MSLTARLSLTGPEANEPEDFFGSALGVIFPDDVINQHGDAEHGLLYTSPHLPRPLTIALADVTAEADRRLFSHYLWNSSLLLAEMVEAGTLGLGGGGGDGDSDVAADSLTASPSPRGNGTQSRGEGEGGQGTRTKTRIAPPAGEFDVTGLSTIELGAGTALPSIMAGLLGARRVVVTDYPTPPVLKTLRQNVLGTVRAEFAPAARFAAEEVLVEGHGWGELDTPLAEANKHAFDRVISADCLWMPWQHDNLRRSVAWFLKRDPGARAWIVAGFHTGREKMRGFFEKEALAEVGLEVEHLWERDCDGKDREWVWDRGVEDVSVRKRWQAVGVLRRIIPNAAAGEVDDRP